MWLHIDIAKPIEVHVIFSPASDTFILFTTEIGYVMNINYLREINLVTDLFYTLVTVYIIKITNPIL